MPGHGPAKNENLVQRWERSHGRGIPEPSLRPIARLTPVRRQGKPQTQKRTCVNPRIRACGPTSQGFAPAVARSSHQQPLTDSWRGRAVARPGLTWGHKRMAAGSVSLVAVLRDALKSALLRVGLNINGHRFRPLPDAEKARECWQGGPTPRRSRLFSRNLWTTVGSG